MVNDEKDTENDKHILQVLKAQSEAMINMNERIGTLESLASQQQEVINKLVESISIISEKKE